MEIISPETNPRKTAIIMAAAEVIMRPERCRPRATASSLSCPSSQYSVMRASRKTS